MKSSRKSMDFILLMSVFVLLSLGIIMVFSASAPVAYNVHHDIYIYLKKQIFAAALGFIAMIMAANFDYKKLKSLSPALMAFSIVLLIIVLIPGVGKLSNEARRWIGIGTYQFQPSEIAKLAVIMFFSSSLAKRRDQLQYFFKGLMPYLILIGIIAFLLIEEPHFSGTVIVILVAAVILFCAGAKISHFIIISFPAIAGLGTIVATVPYMRNRVLSFLDPWSDLQDTGWQAVQSLYAIGSGGLFGRGLGRSMQKFLYLPEPENDFIFSVLAEELGFIGVTAVLLLFLIFIWRGIKIAINAPDIFGSLVAIGITSLIAVQSLLNIAVVTSSVPITGVSLPFFSYGGTSLLLFMTEVGILLNISRYSKYERI